LLSGRWQPTEATSPSDPRARAVSVTGGRRLLAPGRYGSAVESFAILGAPIFGLLGVWLGGRLQAKKDDERWQRELEREDA